jgi:hypoxanthine phosphoribosyltransferase
MNVLFDRKTVGARIHYMAHEIASTHRGDPTPIVFVCLLNGGYMFFSDLTKEIDLPIECEFMRVKSYVSKKKQGDIQITKDLETPITDKHIYIVDDIYDTGNTMKAVVEYLHIKNPKSINIIALLKRKENKHHPATISEDIYIGSFHYGFEINDEWVIGYGMDREDGTGRNIPGILAL